MVDVKGYKVDAKGYKVDVKLPAPRNAPPPPPPPAPRASPPARTSAPDWTKRGNVRNRQL
eukprot:602958-Prorocentrum_minimum.AAC.1